MPQLHASCEYLSSGVSRTEAVCDVTLIFAALGGTAVQRPWPTTPLSLFLASVEAFDLPKTLGLPPLAS